MTVNGKMMQCLEQAHTNLRQEQYTKVNSLKTCLMAKASTGSRMVPYTGLSKLNLQSSLLLHLICSSAENGGQVKCMGKVHTLIQIRFNGKENSLMGCMIQDDLTYRCGQDRDKTFRYYIKFII